MEGMMGVKSSASQIKRVKMNAWDMLKLGVLFIQKLLNIDKLSDDFERNFERIVRPYYGREIHGTNEELYALFKNIEKDIVKEFAIPVINDCAVMIYFGMLGMVGVIATLLLLVLEIIVMMTTPTRSSIHCLLSDTVVVDFASQHIFQTQEELDEFLAAQRLEEAQNKNQ